MVDILKHFPHPIPRQNQLELLQILGNEWDKYDVFCIQAPTAAGKSAIAKTLMNAFYGVSVITPTNLLVDQFRQEFPDTPSLSRLDAYTCEEWKRPCPVTRAKLLQFCKGCKCSSDLATAKYRKGPGVYNYHTYLAHKLYRKVLVVDEAHNLLPVIRDRLALRIWQHDARYPHGMWSTEQMRAWVEGLPPNKLRLKKYSALHESVKYECPQYIPQRTTDLFNGKGTLRGQPEERDLIKLLPVDIRDAPPLFWPREVEKVVLLSATISRKDVESLGLGGRRRVCYIECKSPIPGGNRPIVLDPVVNVNRHNMEEASQKLANYIEELAVYHEGQKGVIHATYQMAGLLAQHLHGSRYLFHDRSNKALQYKLFRDSLPGDGRILIACGLYEGIDLPGDLGRWQVISKIPWQSLGSPAVRHMAESDPEWYLWETMKIVIQACGRICRTPTDQGTTYILDGTVDRLLREGDSLVPEFFREALIK